MDNAITVPFNDKGDNSCQVEKMPEFTFLTNQNLENPANENEAKSVKYFLNLALQHEDNLNHRYFTTLAKLIRVFKIYDEV